VRGLAGTVAAYIAVQAAFFVLNYVQKVRLEVMGQEIILDLRESLFRKLLAQPLAFFDRHPAGRLISRVQGDTDALRQMFATTAVAIAEALVLFAGMLVVMTTVSPRLTLVVAGTIPAMIACAWILATGGARRFRAVRARAADVSAFVAERISGMSLIQAYDRGGVSAGQMRELNRGKFVASFRADAFAIAFFHLIFYIEAIGLALELWFGGRWALEGALTIGTLFMFIEYLRRLFEPVARLSEQIDVLQRAVAAAGRVFGLLDLEPAVRDPESPERWDAFENAIELRDVWFSYRGDEEWALSGVSLRIPRGQTWAIVGATGGGKSSIINLLLRFYDPQRGAVLVDGTDVRRLRQRDLRRRMALVLQDVYLFPGDIASNIAAPPDGEEATPEQRAAHAARVEGGARAAGAGRFRVRLPDGLHPVLAERGANLSAGERQLLSFARALAADPDILLLDEATASVDPETEARLQDSLRTLLRGRTAIVIAHRLSTIREADGILVVKDGCIVETGRHEELLARGGVYADLHALQFAEGAS
jgi:ATP-binding cassette subfamily B protein